MFVAALINYIKYGENALKDYGVHFIDFSHVNRMTWLTGNLQYGLSLSTLMLSCQLFRYVIDENLRYAEMMLGTYS